MVVFTALVGFVTASPGPCWTCLLAAALVGTGLVAAGASRPQPGAWSGTPTR